MKKITPRKVKIPSTKPETTTPKKEAKVVALRTEIKPPPPKTPHVYVRQLKRQGIDLWVQYNNGDYKLLWEKKKLTKAQKNLINENLASIAAYLLCQGKCVTSTGKLDLFSHTYSLALARQNYLKGK